MLTTDQKGAIAETAIVHVAIKAGFGVWRPVAEGERYDLILRVGAHLLRVQCKCAALCGDSVSIRCYSSRRTATGLAKRVYTSAEIDGIAAYCVELDRVFWIPIARVDARSEIRLRLEPTRNKQRSRINWADDFDFVATLRPDCGAIAQLGERVAGSHEVAGSSPAGSIEEPRQAGLFS
jgi:hypothetical protein